MTWCINKVRLPQWLSSKESACWAAGDASPVPGSGRYPGGVYGNPPQCSCLENPIERAVWWAAVQRVIKSQTQLKQFRTHAHKGIHLTDSFRTMGGGPLEKATSGWLANWNWVLLTLSLVYRMYILSVIPSVRDIFKDHTTGTTQRDGMGREEGRGFRMGNTCIPVVDSFWYLAKLIQLCKV